MSTLKEIQKTTKPPKIAYPAFLVKALESPNKMAELIPPPPDPVQPWMRAERIASRILGEDVDSTARIPIYPEIADPLPVFPVRITVVTNDLSPIILEVATSLPEVASPTSLNAVPSKSTLETDARGEINLSLPVGTELKYVTSKMGWRGSGINRKRLESLVPLAGSLRVNRPLNLLLYPESGYGALNGQNFQFSLPYG